MQATVAQRCRCWHCGRVSAQWQMGGGEWCCQLQYSSTGDHCKDLTVPHWDSIEFPGNYILESIKDLCRL